MVLFLFLKSATRDGRTAGNIDALMYLVCRAVCLATKRSRKDEVPTVQTLPIFAGVNSNGELKFVGDVPRGAACGCTCATCGAPLVARRGEIRTWHFAHEASQERPDCFAGAVNLLRTLIIHRLQAKGLPPLPTYWTSVSTKFPLRRLEETIACAPGAATVEAWEPDPTQTGAPALLRLASGTGVRLS